MPATRWHVERADGSFEDCGFRRMEVLPSGALYLHNGSIFEPRDRYVIAAGQWLTVTEEAGA